MFEIKQGTRAAVVGFGRAGYAAAHYLGCCGAELLISDSRPYEALNTREKSLLMNYSARYEGGGHTLAFLQTAELVVVSPGIPLDHPILKQVDAAGIPVIGELALAAGKFKSPVIAITGTNGKTTVTELVGELLRAAGKRVFVGGNIGTPVLEYLISPDDYEVVVLEVSSFQLESSRGFEPTIAVLMNITPDHLDRHGTIERYANVKMSIFRGAGVEYAILNGDDRLCRQFKQLSSRDSFIFFGSDADYAACTKSHGVTIKTDDRFSVYDLTDTDLGTVSGTLNSAAALLAVRSFDIEYKTALRVLRNFQPGDHRLQKVAEIDGISYINDSKATNTGAVNVALEQIGGDVILIAGGKDKGDNYQLLREAVRNNVKYLVLIGETSKTMANDLGDLVQYQQAQTMDHAVTVASNQAVAGDTILLSPACASFDMFGDYKQRGDAFVRSVGSLSKQRSGRGVVREKR